VNRCHNHQLNQFAFFGFKSYSFCLYFLEKKESGPDQRGGSFSPLSRRAKDETAQKVQHEFVFSFFLVAGSIYRRPEEEEERYERSSIKEAPVIV
jgi:hypothetical protein